MPCPFFLIGMDEYMNRSPGISQIILITIRILTDINS